MIHGAHIIVYSKDADADRAFFRDVLKYPSVDAGHGWLIFALPPAEVAVHPSDENDVHKLYLMCDDVRAFIAEMKGQKVRCTPVHEERWGSVTSLSLPGGGKLGIYQPKHASPPRLLEGEAPKKSTRQ
jgi:catechol 2,3-dioxygenase-like lactoylglutathione lyase family enzyme